MYQEGLRACGKEFDAFTGHDIGKVGDGSVTKSVRYCYSVFLCTVRDHGDPP